MNINNCQSNKTFTVWNNNSIQSKAIILNRKRKRHFNGHKSLGVNKNIHKNSDHGNCV